MRIETILLTISGGFLGFCVLWLVSEERLSMQVNLNVTLNGNITFLNIVIITARGGLTPWWGSGRARPDVRRTRVPDT